MVRLVPCSAKIKRIASEIASLTLLETVDLTAVLKDTLKMTDKCELRVTGASWETWTL